jgi:hypothetical protein
VELEARSLEPLGQHRRAAAVGFHGRLRERHAEQRLALGKAGTAVPVELQPVAGPVAPELRRDRVAGLREIMWRARVGLRESEPIACLLLQPIDAESSEQHVVGGRILRVQFQAVALKPLHLEWLSFDQFLMLIGGRETEDRQPAVPLPEHAEATTDALVGFGKTALVGLGSCGGNKQQ